jgi:DNA invertase Pin-like site-specific DNA recombinase
LIFNIFFLLAQFKRCLIQERIKARLEAARARGRSSGRKKLENNNPKILMVKKNA